MSNKLVLASAGAGKSQTIVKEALELIKDKKNKILILTYTENNQKEILNKICKEKKYLPSNIHIKGWFSFILEDLIRPYQSCIFEKRISGVFFNEYDPHKRNGKTIFGRGEKIDKAYNNLHYLTKNNERVHTAYISKLASRINKESHGKPIARLEQIYDSILIDEVQDLVGWDFDLIEKLSHLKALSIKCVGDFRQTIYTTHLGTKLPKTNTEKLNKFNSFGFSIENLNISWRCVQAICDFADKVHSTEGIYEKTESKITDIPNEYSRHLGIFSVKQKHVKKYLKLYKPVILRVSKSTQKELCKGNFNVNFGASKGLGFDRVLIIPTDKQKKFLLGDYGVFDKDKTEKAKSSLYVAITRAKYSVAFIYDKEDELIDVERWLPN
ncbi:UvrD-helicase domain-containing protein [Meridianimaribacter flavus]